MGIVRGPRTSCRYVRTCTRRETRTDSLVDVSSLGIQDGNGDPSSITNEHSGLFRIETSRVRLFRAAELTASGARSANGRVSAYASRRECSRAEPATWRKDCWETSTRVEALGSSYIFATRSPQDGTSFDRRTASRCACATPVRSGAANNAISRERTTDTLNTKERGNYSSMAADRFVWLVGYCCLCVSCCFFFFWCSLKGATVEPGLTGLGLFDELVKIVKVA